MTIEFDGALFSPNMSQRLRVNGQEVGHDEPIRVGSNILKQPSLRESLVWYVRQSVYFDRRPRETQPIFSGRFAPLVIACVGEDGAVLPAARSSDLASTEPSTTGNMLLDLGTGRTGHLSYQLTSLRRIRLPHRYPGRLVTLKVTVRNR